MMTAFSIALIVAILVSVRREHIRVENSVSWLVAAVVLLFFTSFARYDGLDPQHFLESADLRHGFADGVGRRLYRGFIPLIAPAFPFERFQHCSHAAGGDFGVSLRITR